MKTRLTYPLIYILFAGCFSFCSNSKERYSSSIEDFPNELQIHLQKLDSERILDNNDSTALAYLRHRATQPQLVQIVENKSPLLRILAFRELTRRRDSACFSIAVSHLYDTASFAWFSYDVGGEALVADEMISNLLERVKLSSKEKDSLAYLLITEHVSAYTFLQSTCSALAYFTFSEKEYPIIRKIALYNKNEAIQRYALKALSRFQKKQDVPLIKRYLEEKKLDHVNFAFSIIEVFPDDSFFPFLQFYFEHIIKREKQYSSDDLKMYCEALAHYQTKESLTILTALTKKETYPYSYYLDHNKEFVFKAISKNLCPLYLPLYNHLLPQMNDYVKRTAKAKALIDPYNEWIQQSKL